jgi:hypothetical protein
LLRDVARTRAGSARCVRPNICGQPENRKNAEYQKFLVHPYARETPAFRPWRDSAAAQPAPVPASFLRLLSLPMNTVPSSSLKYSSERRL